MSEERGIKALRRLRLSIRDATYFLTLCTNDRADGLTNFTIAHKIRSELISAELDECIQCRAAVIMPNHLHLLFTLTGTLNVSQIVGRLKAKTRDHLRTCGIRWQTNFYEHRLRPDDRIEDVVRYIFLNPFRAELISEIAGNDNLYPHFWLGADEAEWFRPTLAGSSKPIPEWLR